MCSQNCTPLCIYVPMDTVVDVDVDIVRATEIVKFSGGE